MSPKFSTPEPEDNDAGPEGKKGRVVMGKCYTAKFWAGGGLWQSAFECPFARQRGSPGSSHRLGVRSGGCYLSSWDSVL